VISSTRQAYSPGYHKFVKSFAFLLICLLALTFTGCTDNPHVRMIGSPAQDFTVKDADRTISLHDYRGKIVLLNFWASWCAPCIEEMPSLVQLQKRMGPKVTVVAVSIDEDEAAYHKFLRDHNVDLLTVRDPQQRTSTMYGTTGWPETFVIDPKGTIRRKFIGAVDWTSPEIVDYLNKL
jgi:cytochrome c biogenesis protein CcmG, thiol:disulfide interchange protein DsbE